MGKANVAWSKRMPEGMVENQPCPDPNSNGQRWADQVLVMLG